MDSVLFIIIINMTFTLFYNYLQTIH